MKKNRFLQNKTFVVFSILALLIILAAIFAPDCYRWGGSTERIPGRRIASAE